MLLQKNCISLQLLINYATKALTSEELSDSKTYTNKTVRTQKKGGGSN